MPTILHELHVEVPANVQGSDLSTIEKGKGAQDTRKLYAETFLPRLHFNWSELRGIETERYHLIDAPKPELYDLSTDPGETTNLYSQKPGIAEELRSELSKLVAQYSPGGELAQKTGLDPALMERLKSLGYAGFSGGGSITVGNRNLPDPKDRIETYETFSDAMSDSQHARYQESVDKLAVVLKTEPDSVPAHYILGLDYYRTGQFPLAIEHLRRVLELSPDYALDAYQLGLAYARNGQMDGAIEALGHALRLDPTNFDAAYNLGVAYLQKQSVVEAISAFRQATAINPDYPPAHKALGQVLLYQGQVDEALTELRRAAELQPDDPAVHTSLAQALEAKGMSQEAEEEKRRAEQVQPR
jgi:Flp pilus assembly protein TadD